MTTMDDATWTPHAGAYHAEVFHSAGGTRYLKDPGIVRIGYTVADLSDVQTMLENLDPAFGDYLSDPIADDTASGELLVKFLGQLDYLSFGEGRTKNMDIDRYFRNIKAEKHGALFEHVYITLLFYGISRSCSHEIVRHRAGFGFSQVSQRYVNDEHLRFVERPEFVDNPDLHRIFETWIDMCAEQYNMRALALMEAQGAGTLLLTGEKKRDLRKKVNQAARSCLPNETETMIGVTANVRGWRHFLENRASEHAETEIRRLAARSYVLLQSTYPYLFNDYEVVDLADGTTAVSTPYVKV